MGFAQLLGGLGRSGTLDNSAAKFLSFGSPTMVVHRAYCSKSIRGVFVQPNYIDTSPAKC